MMNLDGTDMLNAKVGYNAQLQAGGLGGSSSGSLSLGGLGGGGGGILTPANWLLGAFAVLIGLKLLGDSEKTSIEGKDIFVGGYNVAVILGIIFVFVPLVKIVFNKLQVPGLTDLVNAV